MTVIPIVIVALGTVSEGSKGGKKNCKSEDAYIQGWPEYWEKSRRLREKKNNAKKPNMVVFCGQSRSIAITGSLKIQETGFQLQDDSYKKLKIGTWYLLA